MALLISAVDTFTSAELLLGAGWDNTGKTYHSERKTMTEIQSNQIYFTIYIFYLIVCLFVIRSEHVRKFTLSISRCIYEPLNLNLTKINKTKIRATNKHALILNVQNNEAYAVHSLIISESFTV